MDMNSTNETIGNLIVSSSSSAITNGGILTATNFDIRASGTISTKLAGIGAKLTKSTSGSADLTGANTFTGGVEHNAGTLRVNNATALGPAGSLVALADGVTLSTTAGTARSRDAG